LQKPQSKNLRGDVDNQRKVEKVCAGAFNENTKAEMEAYFGISADGVR